MTASFNKKAIRILVVLLPIQAACVSHQHQPDPGTLTQSAHCEVIIGSYIVDSEEEGRVLAKSLFQEDEAVAALTIEKTPNQVALRASTVNGRMLPAVMYSRFSCADSVLKLILSDQHSADGVFMNASDQVLELFVSDESSLNLRFINTTLAFFFIIPYYSSSDELITLREQSL